MTTLLEIRHEIERLTERRAELFHLLSQGPPNADAVAEREQVEQRLAQLWEQHRLARARVRFGDPKTIIARARQEERIDRAA